MLNKIDQIIFLLFLAGPSISYAGPPDDGFRPSPMQAEEESMQRYVDDGSRPSPRQAEEEPMEKLNEDSALCRDRQSGHIYKKSESEYDYFICINRNRCLSSFPKCERKYNLAKLCSGGKIHMSSSTCQGGKIGGDCENTCAYAAKVCNDGRMNKEHNRAVYYRDHSRIPGSTEITDEEVEKHQRKLALENACNDGGPCTEEDAKWFEEAYSSGGGGSDAGGGGDGKVPVPEPRPNIDGSGTTGSGNSVAGNNGVVPASTPPANKPYDGGDGESPYRDRQDSYDAQDDYADNDKNQYNNGNSGGNGSSGGGYGGGQSPNLPGFNNGGPVTANNTDGSEVTGGSKRNYSSETVGGGAGNMENSPFGGGNNDYYSGGSANDYGARGYKVASNEDHSGYSRGAPQAGLVADENSLNTAAASKASGNRLPNSSEKGNPSFFNHKNMGDGLGEWNGQKITEEGLRKGIYKGMSEKMRRDLLQQIADNVNRNFRLNSVRSTEIEKPILSDYSLKTFYTMPMYGDEALLEQACRSCREPIVIGKHKDGTPIYGVP